MRRKFELFTENDTQALGSSLARVCSRGSSIHLIGALAAGKTTLARGYLRALGYDGAVKSPTFTLVETYEFDFGAVHHFDLYRLRSAAELELIGIDEYFSEGADCLIEWPTRGQGVLPVCDIEVYLNLGKGRRRAEIHACSKYGEKAVGEFNSQARSTK